MTTPPGFFETQLSDIRAWTEEFSKNLHDPAYAEKLGAVERFLADCVALERAMRDTLDPSLSDTVDLNQRHQVLELTRRRLINVVPTEKTAF